jgi:hypothetical protein
MSLYVRPEDLMLRFLFMFAAEAGGDMLNKLIIYFSYRINAASTVRRCRFSLFPSK